MNALWCVLCKADENNPDTVVGPFESTMECGEWIGEDIDINGGQEDDYSILPFLLHD